MKKLNLFSAILCKILFFLRKQLIKKFHKKIYVDVYNFLFKMNLKAYYGWQYDLEEEILCRTHLGNLALKSHAKMVLGLFPELDKEGRKNFARLVKKAYRDNILLKQRV